MNHRAFVTIVGQTILASAAVFCMDFSEATQSDDLIIAPKVFESPDLSERLLADSGFVKVPENYSDPSSKSVYIPFRRFRSTSGSAKSALIFSDGGPGQASIPRFSKWPNRFKTLKEWVKFTDVILYESRGNTESEAIPNLRCPEYWSSDLATPWQTRREYVDMMSAHASKCAAFFKSHHINYKTYTFSTLADDLDRLRHALGYERLLLVGQSGGPATAMTYLRKYPDRVLRAALVIPVVPQFEFARPSDGLPMLNHVASQYDAQIRAGESTFIQTLSDLLGRLRSQAVTVLVTDDHGNPASITIGAYDLQYQTYWTLFETNAADELIPAFRAMAHDDFTWLGKMALRWRRGEVDSNLGGKVLGQVAYCAAGRTPREWELYRLEEKTALLGGEASWGPVPEPELCDAWGISRDGDSDKPINASAPVLFVAGEFDPVEPPRGPVSWTKRLPNSETWIVEAAGHDDGVLWGDSRTAVRLMDYLRLGVLSPGSVSLVKP